MRLIDAEEWVRDLKERQCKAENEEKLIEAFIEIIDTIPTVDAVPVVRGEWNIGSKPRCSVCGKPALREYDRDDWLSYVPSNFCPNCGADMRKKVE